MSAMSRTAVAVLFVALFFTLACGGGGSSSSAAPPVFSLSDPGAASEGASFTYTLHASDPKGGSVTFALVSAPTGATLSGATITWTPTHAQSRQANEFTVHATSSSGGTATASFTVTPAGTIVGTDVMTNWTSAGATDHAADLSRLTDIRALVPDGKGGYTAYAGQGGVGTFSVPGVPAGYYWLQVGAQMYWTNANDVDLGGDTSLSVAGWGPSQQLTVNASLDGLDPWKSGPSATGHDNLQGIIPSRGNVPAFGARITFTDLTSIPDGATTFSGQLPVMAFPEDPSKGDLTYLLQSETLTGTTGASPWTQYRVVKATGPLSLFVDATTTSLDIAATFPADNSSSAYIGARSAGFNSSVAASNPNSSARAASGFRAGVYTTFSDRYTALPSVIGMTIGTSGGFSGGIPQPSLNPMFSLTVPGIPLASVTYGTQLESDLAGDIGFVSPFSSFGKNIYTAEQETAVVAFQSGNEIDYQFAGTGYLSTSAPSATKPFDAPLLNVQNAKINGADLFQTTNVTEPVALSWDAPQLGSPNGYVVTVATYDPSGGNCPPSSGTPSGFCPALVSIHRFTTPTTSITIPSGVLTSGPSYVFTIRAVSDAGTDFLKAPNRGSWNHAFSDVMSNAITVGVTTSAQIHSTAMQAPLTGATTFTTIFQEVGGKVQQFCIVDENASAGACKN